MKIQKISKKSISVLLATGAGITLGLLSFGGMFVFVPSIAIAALSGGLAFFYEGQIYGSNILDAIDKVWKSDYLRLDIAGRFLKKERNIYDENKKKLDGDPEKKEYPQFIEEYYALEDRVSETHDRATKKKLRKELKARLRYFSDYLFEKEYLSKTEESAYRAQLKKWLKETHGDEQKNIQSKWRRYYIISQFLKVFAVLSGGFMFFGTAYLLSQAFIDIPLLSAIPFEIWPSIIFPLAALAGVAYVFLVFNAMTDIMYKDTIQNLITTLTKLKDKRNWTAKNIGKAIVSFFLLALSIALTICTAGTWWTIGKDLYGLVDTVWVGLFIAFTTIASFSFNTENILETLHILFEETLRNPFKELQATVNKAWNNESKWSFFNPFRFILTLTLVPCLILLFIGHLISIGVTGDRMPGVPEIVSSIFGFISELFEDAHYFFDMHEHDCGHDHSHNIPTLVIELAFMPLFLLAAAWDYGFSRDRNWKESVAKFVPPVFLPSAWISPQCTHGGSHAPVAEPVANNAPSLDWKKEHALHKISAFKHTHLSSTWTKIQHKLFDKSSELCEAKKQTLNGIEDKVNKAQNNNDFETALKLEEPAKEALSARRTPSFFQDPAPTATITFIENLAAGMG